MKRIMQYQCDFCMEKYDNLEGLISSIKRKRLD